MEELAALRRELAGRRVSDVLLRACVDGRAVVLAPRIAEPATFDLRVRERRDLELAEAGAEMTADDVEDLLGLRDRTADELDLGGRLPAAQRVDDRLGGDEPVDERSAREGLVQQPPEAMRQAVGSGVAVRVVERDRSRREPLDGLDERRPDALVVADDLVRADLLDARRVEAAHDGRPLPGGRDQERARPRAVRPRDQLEARVVREQRLADERQPEIDVLLAQDLGSLVELLPDEAGVLDGHAADATCSRQSRPRSSQLSACSEGTGTSRVAIPCARCSEGRSRRPRGLRGRARRPCANRRRRGGRLR
jgi:hypothetical protein